MVISRATHAAIFAAGALLGAGATAAFSRSKRETKPVVVDTASLSSSSCPVVPISSPGQILKFGNPGCCAS